MKFFGRKSAGSLGLSIAIHGLLLFVLGGLVLVAPGRKRSEVTASILEESAELPVTEEEMPEEPSADPGAMEPTAQKEAGDSAAEEILTTANSPFQWGAVMLSDSGQQGPGTLGSGVNLGAGDNGRKKTIAKIRGMDLSADKLGVILDISGSMRPYLEETVRQIHKQFPNYELVLVEGCCVAWYQRSEEQFKVIQIRRGGSEVFENLAGKYTPAGYSFIEKAGTGNLLAAVKYLVAEKGCDAVYFFSDFNDAVNEGGVDKLRGFLHGSQLYLDSTGVEPQEALTKLAQKSGGGVKVEEKR